MRIVKVTPTSCTIEDIEDTLEAKQKLVGGYIEATYPFDDYVAVVCNEEGKILGLPKCRMMCCDNIPYDIICGDFFICGLSEDDFDSLTEEQAEKYQKMFTNYIVNI